MSRTAFLAVAVACYLIFFAAFVYLIGFIGGFSFMPTSVDKGLVATPALAVAIDVALIAIFGLQHSVMARQGFKAGWTRIVPPPIERSIYCLATSAALALLFAFWHPISGEVWNVTAPGGRIALWALFALGWTVLFISTHLINHWELFGLAQAWRHFRGREAQPHKLRMPLFYRYVRHPLYSGFVLAFWAAPVMSYGHLLLSIGLTIYILVGIHYEEKDLVSYYGDVYVQYRRKVGALIPGIGRRA
jgi:protein-S-isoprenylcysteine O-methyltransferase Ste14